MIEDRLRVTARVVLGVFIVLAVFVWFYFSQSDSDLLLSSLFGLFVGFMGYVSDLLILGFAEHIELTRKNNIELQKMNNREK